MWHIQGILMSVGGLAMIVFGMRYKMMWYVAFGACFIGSGVFGELAVSNEMYEWFRWPFTIGLVALVLLRFVQIRKLRQGR